MPNKKIEEMLGRTKFTIASGENIYSLFILEAIIKQVKILIPSNYNYKINNFKNNFIFLNFNKIQDFKKLIMLKNFS